MRKYMRERVRADALAIKLSASQERVRHWLAIEAKHGWKILWD